MGRIDHVVIGTKLGLLGFGHANFPRSDSITLRDKKTGEIIANLVDRKMFRRMSIRRQGLGGMVAMGLHHV